MHRCAQGVKAACVTRGRERNSIVESLLKPKWYGDLSFVSQRAVPQRGTSSWDRDSKTMMCLAVCTSGPEWGHQTAIRKMAPLAVRPRSPVSQSVLSAASVLDARREAAGRRAWLSRAANGASGSLDS